MSTGREADWFLGKRDSRHIGAIIPRVLPVEPNGTIRMIRHKDWNGALGGHITLDEAAKFEPDTNLLDIQSMLPTLARETWEEGRVGLERYLRDRAAVLGIAEVLMVRKDTGTSVDTITPMILCKIPGGLAFSDDVIRVPWGHIPRDTYPDAALALIHLYTQKRKQASGPILPVWLNQWGKVVFELSPKRRYLRGEPPLKQLGFVFDAPEIPKRYPPDIQDWMQHQYARM